MSIDTNMVRGQMTFNTTLNSHISANPESEERLSALRGYFLDKVGVMPGELTFAAKRMATACIQASLESTKTLDESVLLAISLYEGAKTSNVILSRIENSDNIKTRGISVEGYVETENEEHVQNTKKLAQLIENSVSVLEKEAFTVEDEDGETREMYADVIDLIDDAASEGELSIEGMRSLGIIDLDFNPKKDKVGEFQLRAAEDLVQRQSDNWIVGEDGYVTILCPKCFGQRIYPFGEGNKFGCFDCDTEFIFKHNLADIR